MILSQYHWGGEIWLLLSTVLARFNARQMKGSTYMKKKLIIIAIALAVAITSVGFAYANLAPTTQKVSTEKPTSSPTKTPTATPTPTATAEAVESEEEGTGETTEEGSPEQAPVNAPPAAAPPAPPAAPTCPGNPGGGGSAPSAVSPLGVAGTSSSDIQSFSAQYNAIRVANCLEPVSPSNFRYDSCMEQRLFWMAEDPSEDPMSAWGHVGSQRSDGVPSVGCDGNLAGGNSNTGSTVAQKWWDSSSHRASLYRPGSSPAGACIYFAMTHGGVPNEPASFTRAAARWGSC